MIPGSYFTKVLYYSFVDDSFISTYSSIDRD